MTTAINSFVTKMVYPVPLWWDIKMIMASIEHEILTYCSDADPARDRLQKIRGCMSNTVDMDRLIDLALKEGLGGFLYKSLLKAGLLETVNPQHKQKLYTNFYLTVRKNVKLLHALNTILEDLNKKEIDIVLLQGMSLLQETYKDVGLRPMNDMDLWVLSDNFPKLVDTLIEQGFESNRLYANAYRKGEIILDIHTHLLWADRIKARDFLLSKRQEVIFQNSKKINCDEYQVLCLGPRDQFLYLGLHALKHNFERLIWLVDIKSLVAEWTPADWDSLVRGAQELGHKKTLRYVLYLLIHIFNLRVPPEITSFLNKWKPGHLEKKMLHRRIKGRSIPTWAQLIMISNGRRLRDRISFFYETIFPRPEILRQVFANSPQLGIRQLYWRRILQVVGLGRPS